MYCELTPGAEMFAYHQRRLFEMAVRQAAIDGAKLPVHFDENLLFWAQHFDGKDWAVYDNGVRKGGTLRFKEGVVRLPFASRLPVYETQEHKNGLPPRAMVDISRVIVCEVDQLPADVMRMDGFESTAQLLESMAKYYPSIRAESIVSFYEFGKTDWA